VLRPLPHPFLRHKDRNGIRREASKWYLEFKDPNEVLHRLSGFTDARATKELSRLIDILKSRRALKLLPEEGDLKQVEQLPNRIKRKLAAWGVIDQSLVAASQPLTSNAILLLEQVSSKLRYDHTPQHAIWFS